MYAWIWRLLPGALLAKVVQAMVLAVVVMALLLLVVFPWISPHLPFNHVTVDTPPSPAPQVSQR